VASISRSSAKPLLSAQFRLRFIRQSAIEGPLRQRSGEFDRGGGQLFVGDDAVDEIKRQRLVGIDRAPSEIEFARFGRADRPGEKEAPAADNRRAVEAQIRSLLSNPLQLGMQPSLTPYWL
jgi:hypothetical protein